MNKSILKCLWIAVLAVITAGPAFATAIPVEAVRLDADCEGYTIFAEGTNFEPGEILEVEYRITLDALTAGNDSVVVEGMIALDAAGCTPDPGRTTCDISTSESFTWTEALGFALPCGDYMLNTGTDGTCDGKPSRYIWTSPATGEVFCERLFPIDTWDGMLNCPCEDGDEVCRTPGFWKTHAGDAKKKSQNVTQQVLDAAMMGIEVCGTPIFTTALDRSDSALEAMCVSPSGDSRLQLIRQLTAAALNCVMTNGNGDCFGVSIGDEFSECNAACAAGDEMSYSDCIDAIDCFNNGGALLGNGMCQTGTCMGTGDPCDEDDTCGLDDMGYPVECLPLEGNCHDRALVNDSLGLDFDPPGPAGSSKTCNSASKNDCTLLGGCSD